MTEKEKNVIEVLRKYIVKPMLCGMKAIRKNYHLRLTRDFVMQRGEDQAVPML